MGLLTKAPRTVATHAHLVMVLVLLLLLPAGEARPEKAKKRVALVIVTGNSNKADSISLRELKKRYDGDNPDRSVMPFNHPPKSAPRLAFDRKVLGLSSSQVGRYWVDRKIRGRRGAPRSLASGLLVAKVVARFPGAIGYMRADRLPSWVKALKVEGKKYTDSDYPLFVSVPQ